MNAHLSVDQPQEKPLRSIVAWLPPLGVLSVLLLIGLLLASCPGCGSGSYQEGMEKQIAEMKRLKAEEEERQRQEEIRKKRVAELAPWFAKLTPEEKLGDTPVSYRMISTVDLDKAPANPKKAEPSYRDGKEPDGKVADVLRWKPPKIELPVPVSLTWEMYVGANDDSEQVPCYCYLGAKPMAQGENLMEIAKRFQGKLQAFAKANSGQASEVMPLPVETADAQKKSWVFIRYEGNQEFVPLNKATSKGGKPQKAKMIPGGLTVCLFEEGGYLVEVVGRIPKPIEDARGGVQKIVQMAALIAGSIKVAK